jgi:hypothetical protein
MMRIHTPSFVQSTQSIDFAQNACFDIGHWRDVTPSLTLDAPKRDASVMTIGITMLCEGGKTAVMIAGRLISHSVSDRGIDTDYVKVKTVGPNALVVFSGDITHRDLILERLGDPSGKTPNQLADALRSACASVVRKETDAKLREYGMRLRTVRADNFNQVTLAVSEGIVAKTRLKAGFVVAASAEDGVFLYFVNDQIADRRNDPGFAVTGSGLTYSHPVLVAKAAHKGMGLEEAIFAAYEAKRVSEEVGTVGRQSDLAIIEAGKPARLLSKGLVDELDAMYERRLKLAKNDKNAIRRLIET